MPGTRAPHAPGFRRRMVDLVRAGRDPDKLAREFEPAARPMREGGLVGAGQESRNLLFLKKKK